MKRPRPGAASTALVWLRGTDLRLHDNAILAEARRCRAVVPVFVFDPRQFGMTRFGTPKTGAFRTAFLLESLLDLQNRLRGVGSDLVVLQGAAEEVLPAAAAKLEDPVVLTQQQATSEEFEVEQAVRARLGCDLVTVWDYSLYHLDDLPFRKNLSDLPDGFTPFKNKVESQCRVRDEMPEVTKGSLPLPAELPGPTKLPALEELPFSPDARAAVLATDRTARSVVPGPGGETAALARLQYYLWETNHVAKYFDTRNGMLGADYSTKLSPWLAHGCISPRRVYHEIQRYQSSRTQNKSTYWVLFELTWRDFFRFFSLKHGTRIFRSGGTAMPDETVRRRWKNDESAFARWRDGRTGYPLVDANMREMNATGFMSNRGRQNVASFLVHDLGLDWRRGADYFESVLVDYDVTANWGNWVAAAGLTGGRVNRFNVVKQARDYDARGDYVRHWLPELREIAPGDARIFERYSPGGGGAVPPRPPTQQSLHAYFKKDGGAAPRGRRWAPKG